MVKSNDELFKAMSKTLQASFKLSIQKYQLFPAENERVIFLSHLKSASLYNSQYACKPLARSLRNAVTEAYPMRTKLKC